MTTAGSSLSKRVLYMAAACVMFRGTQTRMPGSAPSSMVMGEPVCQMPWRRWPLVRITTGAIWPPAVR